MLGFPLGILSAAGAGGVAAVSDYELIESVILGSSQSTITFSSLGTYSSTYKHLQLRSLARSDRASAGDGGYIRFNSDTGANYASHVLVGDGSSVQSFASPSQAQMGILAVNGNTATANFFAQSVIDILDPFSTTKNKTLRSSFGNVLYSGLWMNTASLTTITITTQIGPNFIAGSRFSLYGIKG